MKTFLRHGRLAVTVVILCGLSYAIGRAQTRPVSIHNGFITAQEYRNWKEVSGLQKLYAAGVTDGILLAPMFGAPKANLYWVENCIEGMTDIQVAAILSKHLEDTPEIWHYGAHTAMYGALVARCPGAPRTK